MLTTIGSTIYIQIEMEQVDEDIRSWSAGKENNICLLLSTLHQVGKQSSLSVCSFGYFRDFVNQASMDFLQILWPNSGWSMVPITNLIECSNVKKAYQKARLCLHPDKLQQRGAAPREKYIADKAFSILQVIMNFPVEER